VLFDPDVVLEAVLFELFDEHAARTTAKSISTNIADFDFNSFIISFFSLNIVL
jgi:hypothetical protein